MSLFFEFNCSWCIDVSAHYPVILFSEVPTGFKKIDLPVVRFDSLKSSGEFLTGDDREFTILPEGKLVVTLGLCKQSTHLPDHRSHFTQNGRIKWATRP